MSEKTLKKLEILGEHSNPDFDHGKAAWIRKYTVRHEYDNGEFSRPYRLDVVSHVGIDAVGVVPYWRENGETFIALLHSFRPALTLREIEPSESPYLVEIVAGVMEKGEYGPEGVRHRAAEELLEEAGYISEETKIEILGSPFYVSPGVYTEKIWLCAAQVDPGARRSPRLDGSVMEEMISSFSLSLNEALDRSRSGRFADAKTEIALERLARHLNTTH